ncbi:hypothetical protein EVAR_44046_1 [Eumeta japonica]|uniref:Uncharacterized protein n=1 Tax=Eumeta variegata TaxID=151549 RepID=A0A4C1XIJ5_EUMVA|nr:hypothetical protein EVAR_44046_1 [Eumeta japonica]
MKDILKNRIKKILQDLLILTEPMLEEERKIKAVLRNISLEIPTDCIKSDLENQNYPVFAVHRMHSRDGTEIDLVLAVLHKSDTSYIYDACQVSPSYSQMWFAGKRGQSSWAKTQIILK